MSETTSPFRVICWLCSKRIETNEKDTGWQRAGKSVCVPCYKDPKLHKDPYDGSISSPGDPSGKTRWDKHLVNHGKYDRRFNYYRATGRFTGGTYVRKTKTWWLPFMYLGHKVKHLTYYIHSRYAPRNTLTDEDYRYAEELSKSPGSKVSKEEFLDRFSCINPYCQKPYSTILWWVRRHLTYD